MVKHQDEDIYERLEDLVKAVAAEHELYVDITGWTRKTFDVYKSRENRGRDLIARVESLAAHNGIIEYYDDSAKAFALALAEKLETEFETVNEATLVRKDEPLY